MTSHGGSTSHALPYPTRTPLRHREVAKQMTTTTMKAFGGTFQTLDRTKPLKASRNQKHQTTLLPTIDDLPECLTPPMRELVFLELVTELVHSQAYPARSFRVSAPTRMRPYWEVEVTWPGRWSCEVNTVRMSLRKWAFDCLVRLPTAD